MAQYLITDPPTPEPRKFGIFSVADVRDAQPHELDGIQYYSDNCSINVQATSDAICAGTPTRTTTVTSRGNVQRTAFPVYVYTQCAGVNEFRDAQNRAVAIMNAGVERAIELKVQALLAADAGILNQTPASVPRQSLAVGIVENYLDLNYAGVGTLITSRTGLSVLSSDGQATGPKGNRLETKLGTPIFGSSQITLGPSGAAPAAGEAWLYGVGKITVRLGQQFASDPVFVQTADTNEVQSLAITGAPTGGTYTLTFDGQTTTALAYNANAATIQSALIALSNVDAGDVTVTGTGPFTITFGGQYAGDDVPQITATASLTGGTAPAATVTTTTGGSDQFGDNTYRVMVQRLVLVDWDCYGVAVKYTL